MSLVDIEEVSGYMSGINLNNNQKASAQIIIEGVQAALERYCKRPLEPVLVQESIQADDHGFLQFSVTPIWDIVSLVDSYGRAVPFRSTPNPNFAALTHQDLENAFVERSYDVARTVFDGAFPIDRGALQIGVPGYWYVVRYVGGYLGWTDADIKLGIIRVAAREIRMRHDDSVSVKEGTTKDSDKSSNDPIGWTNEELKGFDRLRRRTFVRGRSQEWRRIL